MILFHQKFDQFSHIDCKGVDGQHPEAKLLNEQGALSTEIPSKYV